MHKHRILMLALALVLLPNLSPHSVAAQTDCGVVDGIDYPLDGISTIRDDFGMYRAAAGNRHTGIDMAFGRFGEPVQAAARGRVTFSDVQGWGTEKGVVVIEHLFPDGSIFFSLYGHMEETDTVTFPTVARCVERGDVIGTVGDPENSARHLHYEIRKMRSSTGGPGYVSSDPLSEGWMHPIEFTEAWRLRLNPAYRSMVSATNAPVAPPVWMPDGTAIFASETAIEQRNGTYTPIWRLDVPNLLGIVGLPNGSVLVRTATDRMLNVQNGRFIASWQADRAWRRGPFRMGDKLLFIDTENRVVGYTFEGVPLWQTAPLGAYLEAAVQSGDLLAVTTEQDGSFNFWVINSNGEIVFPASSPAPISAHRSPTGGFLISVSSQIGYLGMDMLLRPLMDTGRGLARGTQAVQTPQGEVIVYPGYGSELFAYNADGTLRWTANLYSNLPGAPFAPPLLATGLGCAVYVLTFDGTLSAIRMADGTTGGSVGLYAGGINNTPAGRAVEVLPGEQVRFSAGYLSVATIDGSTLAGC